jgi:hypothetical protein
MLVFRTVQQSDLCAREEFLYELKAGLSGGSATVLTGGANLTSRTVRNYGRRGSPSCAPAVQPLSCLRTDTPWAVTRWPPYRRDWG